VSSRHEEAFWKLGEWDWMSIVVKADRISIPRVIFGLIKNRGRRA